MDKFDMSSFKDLYVKTAREYIDKIAKDINVLSEQPTDSDAITDLYISAHSLGSQSTLTNYKSIESVCAVIERIFQKVKEGDLKISEDLLIALKNAITGLTKCLDSIDKDNKEIDLFSIKEELQKL